MKIKLETLRSIIREEVAKAAGGYKEGDIVLLGKEAGKFLGYTKGPGDAKYAKVKTKDATVELLADKVTGKAPPDVAASWEKEAGEHEANLQSSYEKRKGAGEGG